MSNKGLYKTSLVFAVLTAISWVLFIIGTMISPQVEGMGFLEQYLTSAKSTGTLIYT